MDHIFAVFSCPFFFCVSRIHYRFGLYVPEIIKVSICRMMTRFPMLVIKGVPADYDTQICQLSPLFIIIIRVFTSALADGLPLEFPHVPRTLLSILAVLNNAVVWMVSTRPPTSKSSSPFSNPFVIVPNAPITIGIIVTCMFQSFFNSLARSRNLSVFSHSFSFYLWSAGTAKSTILQDLFFCCWLL